MQKKVLFALLTLFVAYMALIAGLIIPHQGQDAKDRSGTDMHNNSYKGAIIYHGRTEKPFVALTFDDGPGPYTLEILKILKEKNVKATFFAVGKEVKASPDVLQKVVQEGHSIGSHSYTHPQIGRMDLAGIRNELDWSEKNISRITGKHVLLFRSPFGLYTRDIFLKEADKDGYICILWSVDSNDWARPPVKRIIADVLEKTSTGDIILMHDGGGDRSRTVKALPVIIDSLKQRGLSFVTLEELLDLKK
jgi:peptidoglycan/xylan/chitin deacetylase (PgdA/CDA1 family)